MSQDSPTLIPVPFHGDTITAIETPQGEFVAIRPICDRLNLNFSGQLQRLKAFPDLWGVCVIHTPSAGGAQETNCIPRSRVAAWLFKIEVSRVKPEARETLRVYQREAADVLDRHFRLRQVQRDAALAELRAQLYHCHLHLRARNPDWAAIEALWRDGCLNSREMAMVLRSKATLVDAKRGWMENCGLIGTDFCKEPQRPDSMLDRLRDLEWRLAMKEGRSAPAEDGQLSLFGSDAHA